MAYRELAHVLCRSRVVYVPDTVEGGGERAVLEVSHPPPTGDRQHPRLHHSIQAYITQPHAYIIASNVKAIPKLRQAITSDRGPDSLVSMW